jgi:arginine exporter protein ArgO
MVEKIGKGRNSMRPAAYFFAGFVTASVLWLIGVAVLNGELFRTFSSFSGH